MSDEVPLDQAAHEGYPRQMPSEANSGSQPPYEPPPPYFQAYPPPYGQQQYAPHPQTQSHHAMHQGMQYGLPAWQFVAPPKPKSSGYRVASGIVGIVSGFLLIAISTAGLSYSGGTAVLALLTLLTGLGAITAGIILLVCHRSRRQAAAINSLAVAGFALLLGVTGVTVPFFGWVALIFILVLTTPIFILLGLDVSRKKRGA